MVDQAFCTNPKFAVYFNFEAWMLTNLTAGMSPVSNMADALAQVALTGLFRFVSLFYLNDWWRIIRNMSQEKNKNGAAARTTYGAMADNGSVASKDKSEKGE
jgi:hypothetical protein